MIHCNLAILPSRALSFHFMFIFQWKRKIYWCRIFFLRGGGVLLWLVYQNECKGILTVSIKESMIKCCNCKSLFFFAQLGLERELIKVQASLEAELNMRNQANNAKADVESMFQLHFASHLLVLCLSFSSFCKGWGFGILMIDARFPKPSYHFLLLPGQSRRLKDELEQLKARAATDARLQQKLQQDLINLEKARIINLVKLQHKPLSRRDFLLFLITYFWLTYLFCSTILLFCSIW